LGSKISPNYSLDNISNSDIKFFAFEISRLLAKRKKGRGQ
jgi:hypothetical protein